MSYKNEISYLLRKYFLGTITQEEQRALDCWLKEDDEHEQLFERLRKDTRFGEEYGIFCATNTEQAWKTFRVKTGINKKPRIFAWRKYAAAAIILPLMMAALWYLFFMEKEDVAVQCVRPIETGVTLEFVGENKVMLVKEQRATIKVGGGVVVQQNAGELIYSSMESQEKVDTNILRIPRGGEFTLQLADGTRVYLNSASELKYPMAFTGYERQVYLKGEAYFEVSKDAEHPFSVITDDLRVQVYGTSFNMNTHSNDCIQTVLVEGKVGIHEFESNKEYMLKPNEMAVYSRTSRNMEIKEVNPDLYTLWRKGMFVFERETLENIMNTLSLWYDVEVFFQAESVKGLHFSGHMKRYEQIEDILHAITDATGVVFTINGRTICISK